MKAIHSLAFVIAMLLANLVLNPVVFSRNLDIGTPLKKNGADLILNCPTNQNESACQTQSAINTKFSNWLSSVSFTGGCNVNLFNNNSGAPPACGGVAVVTFTATSTCDPTVTCSAVFSVTPSPAVVLNCPTNQVELACQTQIEIDTNFSRWLRTVTYSGGCDASLSNDNSGAPSFCGGSKTVQFILSSSCEPPKTCNATFSVTDAPPVVLSCPQDREEAAGQTQAAIDTKFSAWLQSASFTGGCNPVFSNNNSGAPPSTGGTTQVTFVVKSSCEANKTCSSNFTVKFPSAQEETNLIQKLSITPNPVNDLGYIAIQFNRPTEATIELLNSSGQVVWNSLLCKSDEVIPVNFRTFSPGLYYVRIESRQAVSCFKWLHF